MNQKDGIAQVQKKYTIVIPTIKFYDCNDQSNLKRLL